MSLLSFNANVCRILADSFKVHTYQFITSMQEIKLQDCEQRRRWEWEDVQTELFMVQMKNLKLQQTQEAGSIFINETKNIIITVFSLFFKQLIIKNSTLIKKKSDPNTIRHTTSEKYNKY